ncbi:hypothetical protein BSL78_10075 [Apostichopus japonicus]|uniref:Uncharacterized protein n=1 Tax=Stichopus japonicus TaxID=307972 RepID=A0A2G8KYC0_STIJA|nr:hypothetical protein BSL78_10075 [Apostichopus japonicus]
MTKSSPDVKPEVDPSGKPTNEKALLGKPNSGKGKSKGLDLVIILVVVVAVSIGVVFILVIAVAVLYKKNKESKRGHSVVISQYQCGRVHGCSLDLNKSESC